jgi:curved DNA-binding protein CbpA
MMDSGSNGTTVYYEALGLEPNAGYQEIKRAFHKLALKYHPDRNPGNREAAEKFRIVLEAYKNLMDKDEMDKDEKDEDDHAEKSNGNGDSGKGFRFKQSAKPQSYGEPRCPGCSADGMEHIVSRKGGDISIGRKKLTNSPFMVVFCDKCGHIYNVFNTGL